MPFLEGNDVFPLGGGLLMLLLHQSQEGPGMSFIGSKEYCWKNANTLAEYIHHSVLT